MLPPFNEDGNLPPGIHMVSIGELVERFGSGSVEREVEIRELIEFIEWARQHRVLRIIINGSFVTSKLCPNDVDLVVLPDLAAGNECVEIEFEPEAWPFLQILIAADDEDIERWAACDFATDREGREKGVVEVIL